MYVKAVIKKSKKDIRADGRTPIYLALRENRKEKLIVTEKKISPDHWNDKAGLPNQHAPNYTILKKWINTEVECIEGIILKLEVSKKQPTFEKVHEIYTQGDEVNVRDFCLQELEKQKNGISHSTYQDYTRSINNIDEYQNGITFSAIDNEWLTDYDFYLLNIKKFSVNTRAHDFRTLRKFFRKAITKGIVTHYPFDAFKIRTQETEKDYNTSEEVNLLFALYDSNRLPLRLQKTLAYYLFSCYTCIPGDDLRKKEEKLRFTDNLVSYVRGKTQRKGKLLVVPLSKRAKQLLPFIQEHKLKQKKSRVNQDLKEIMEEVSIQKHITFHCARNTFYVLARRAGIAEGAIQDIFGHSLPSTTNIYKRIENVYIKQEMDKLDNL